MKEYTPIKEKESVVLRLSNISYHRVSDLRKHYSYQFLHKNGKERGKKKTHETIAHIFCYAM